MPAVIEKTIEPGSTGSASGGGFHPVAWVLCIIRSEKLDTVTNALNKLNLVGGMTVTDLRGAGHENTGVGNFLGKMFRRVYLPRVKIELAIEVEDVDRVEKAITEVSRTGAVGDGKIFVFNVKDLMRIRTNERGSSAL